MPSTTSTIVAATIGSNHGSEISTNAFGSSAPAEKTPRGRPRIGLRNRARSPLARSALASVSPANAGTSTPSKRNAIGRDRSIDAPPEASRPAVTAAPQRSGASSTGRKPEHTTLIRVIRSVGRVEDRLLLDDEPAVRVLDVQPVVEVVSVGHRLRPDLEHLAARGPRARTSSRGRSRPPRAGVVPRQSRLGVSPRKSIEGSSTERERSAVLVDETVEERPRERPAASRPRTRTLAPRRRPGQSPSSPRRLRERRVRRAELVGRRVPNRVEPAPASRAWNQRSAHSPLGLSRMNR